MHCKCSQLPEFVKLDDYPVLARLDELEVGNWVRLCHCPKCGQYWSVDEWDKYQNQFAIKIPGREGWQDVDTTPLRQQFLVQSRGGLTDEKCIWLECEQPRVKGVVYCAHHLYQTGSRE